MEARAEHPGARLSATPFLVGIDLGTTNSAVAFVDTRRRGGRVELFSIPQLVDGGVVEPRAILPSFLYFPEPSEIDSGAASLPWSRTPDAVVGVMARDRGALTPARAVSSAKSWLAHPGVDRHAAILPWGSTAGPRISPVDASARYLAHVRDAWNATIARDDERLRLERQQIVLTVPASFEEEPRELTVEAARSAGFDRLTLLEEPIAAFYAWMARSEPVDRRGLDDDQLALVCDVGGGTTDFSLIRVRLDAHGSPSFERVAIGEHLLLGGDNVDVALAAVLEQRILASHSDARLAITQRSALRRSCAAAKERLLSDTAVDRVAITVLGSGRAVIGGASTVEVRRDDVARALDAFLPVSAAADIASPRDRRSGLRELALPYETDPAITRHLAAFLARAAATIDGHPAIVATGGRRMVRPDLLLFNGGFFAPAIARDRVLEALAAWFGRAPRVLASESLDAAVALGAATYARVRAGIGPPVAIVKAGSGHAYYVRVRASEPGDTVPAVCVLARGTDEGTTTRLELPFTVVANRSVSFALYSSATRSDAIGDLVALPDGDDVHRHAPLVTVLRYGRKSRHVELPVRLSVTFTEVGTLELWCESESSEHRWRLQFDLRTREEADQPEAVAGVVVPEEAVATAERGLQRLFSEHPGDVTPENIVGYLEQTLGFAKSAWPLPLIRRLADALLEAAEGRRRSPSLESRWLNLFGFCVRPGFGSAKDPWRIGEARKIYAAGLGYPKAIQNRVEWLVLWQRASGGFSAGQQRELAQRVMGDLGLSTKKGPRQSPQIERESWRLLASLERLDAPLRVRLGDELLSRLRRDPANASLLWSIGRLGARVPLYGALSSVVPPADAARWLDELLGGDMTSERAAAIVQIAARTGDALRDVEPLIVARAKDRLLAAHADPEAVRPLDEIVETSAAEANRVFGEALPDGLQLAQSCAESPAGSR